MKGSKNALKAGIDLVKDNVDAIISMDGDMQHPPSLIPELLGRLPVVTFLNPLDAKALLSILTEPKNALVKQYEKLFSMEGVTLHFSPEALSYIVEQAMQYKLGARGLRSIMEAIMTDAMFEIPSQTELTDFTIDLTYAKSKFERTVFHQMKVVA